VNGLRGAGFLLALLAACAALGLAVSLPLWLFATASPRAYTITALAALAAGIGALVVRAVIRRRAAPGPRGGRGSPLAASLAVLMSLLGLAGAWAAAAFLVRRLWILAAIELVVAAALVVPLGLLRRRLRNGRKQRHTSADTESR
jgi:hypothetical protein